jgi:hypothetical protein
MPRLPVAVLAGVSESVTVSEKLNVPAVVGLPEIVPEELRVKPAGRLEPVARAQVYGAVPPDALKAADGYAPPPTETDPVGSPPDRVATASCASLLPELEDVQPVIKRSAARAVSPSAREDTPPRGNRKTLSITAILLG